MKTRCLYFVISAVLFVGLVGCGQAKNKEDSKAGVQAQVEWLTDLDAAQKKAAELNRPILVDFSGSDWCGWCKKLDREVFSQDEFKAYAKENLVLVLIDFPQSKPQTAEEKQKNRAWAEKYKVEGFPTVLILNAAGEVKAQTGYKAGGAAKYVEHLKGLVKP